MTEEKTPFFSRDGTETEKQTEFMDRFEEQVSPQVWRTLVLMGIGPEFSMGINPHGSWSMFIKPHDENIVSAVMFIHDNKFHFSIWRKGEEHAQVARLEK